MHLFLFNNVELNNSPTLFLRDYISVYQVDLRGTFTDNRLFGISRKPLTSFNPYRLCLLLSGDKFMCAEDAPEMG